MTTLAEPLRDAIQTAMTDTKRSVDYTPLATAILAVLRADPATLEAMAEALHEDGVGRHANLPYMPGCGHEKQAARILDRLFGSPESEA